MGVGGGISWQVGVWRYELEGVGINWQVGE